MEFLPRGRSPSPERRQKESMLHLHIIIPWERLILYALIDSSGFTPACRRLGRRSRWFTSATIERAAAVAGIEFLLRGRSPKTKGILHSHMIIALGVSDFGKCAMDLRALSFSERYVAEFVDLE